MPGLSSTCLDAQERQPKTLQKKRFAAGDFGYLSCNGSSKVFIISFNLPIISVCYLQMHVPWALVFFDIRLMLVLVGFVAFDESLCFHQHLFEGVQNSQSLVCRCLVFCVYYVHYLMFLLAAFNSCTCRKLLAFTEGLMTLVLFQG